jgi:hypothetical protein
MERSNFKIAGIAIIGLFLASWANAVETYPTIESIRKHNTELANELYLLPDIQDGIDVVEQACLEKILELYTNKSLYVEYPEKQKELAGAINSVLNQGIPNKREYCGALQAFFWMVKNRDLKSIIEYDRLSDLSKNDTWMMLSDAWGYCKDENWQDLDTVTERLSSPELILYFIQQGFTYKSDPKGRDVHDSLKHAFKVREGDCEEIAGLVYHFLNENGYETLFLRSIGNKRDDLGNRSHISGIYRDPTTGLYHSIEVRRDSMVGGYLTIKELSQALMEIPRRKRDFGGYSEHKAGYNLDDLFNK